MSRKQSSSNVPRLPLTPRDESELRRIRDELENEILEQYEQFVFRHNRRIDTARWKVAKAHDDLHVFTEREQYRSTWRSESYLPEHVGPMCALTASSSSPIVLVVGTLQGSLDDALFGKSFLDPTSMRVRDAFLKQKADDATLLSVIDGPSAEDPFAVLGVSYATRKSAMALGRRRDMLLLMGVRTSKLSNGERIGIAFHHSIAHDAIPEDRSSCVRANASMVAIYHQLDEKRVEVFILDFCDLGGMTPTYAAVKQSITMLLPQVNECDFGVKKKLHWLMRERQKAKALTITDRDSASSTYSAVTFMPEPRSNPDSCDTCSASLRGLGLFSSSSICQLCGVHICNKCTVIKKIAMDATETVIEKKKFAFCLNCVRFAKNYSAIEIAQRNLDELWMHTMMRGIRRHTDKSEDDSTRTRSATVIYE